MSDELDWRILDRYLAGEATPDEATRARAWLGASPERQALADALTERDVSQGSVNVGSAWRQVASRTVAAPGRMAKRPLRRFSATSAVAWLSAAAIVLAVGLSIALRHRSSTPQATVAQSSWRDVEAPRGSRVSIDLPDGSTVKLNAGSRFRYDSTGHRRDVYLGGEGYFVVKHDAAHPFVVHANGASIRDVGTRFVVRAYGGQPGATVVVAEGAVSLRRDAADARDSVTATAGMLARLTPTGSLATSSVDPARYLGFTDGRLVLDGVTLAAALPMIERWYDVDIRLTDASLAKRQVTAEFSRETASEAMQALSIALDLDIGRKGQSFTVGARKARP